MTFQDWLGVVTTLATFAAVFVLASVVVYHLINRG
jgi:hypothetical protein